MDGTAGVDECYIVRVGFENGTQGVSNGGGVGYSRPRLVTSGECEEKGGMLIDCRRV